MNPAVIDESTALVRAAPMGGSVDLMRDHHASLLELRLHLLKDGHDFGVIKGCGDKPGLFKPGAEKLLQRFCVHTSPGDTHIEDLSAGGEHRYRITLGGRTPDGVLRGVGLGEASTLESKYKWRRAVSKDEWDFFPEERRRLKHFASGSPAIQVRQDPADVANTVLKMAFKRALVALALTATSASEFFTQDIEDARGEVPTQAAAPPPPASVPPPADLAYRNAYNECRKVAGADDKLISAVAAGGVQSKVFPRRSEWTASHGKILLGLVIEAVRARTAAPADAPPPGPDGASPAGASLAGSYTGPAQTVATFAAKLNLEPEAINAAAVAVGAPEDPADWGAEHAGCINDELARAARAAR